MRFTATPLAGAFVVELEPIADERGFFARTWCAHELAAHGLNPRLAQCSLSYNRHRGTLRGLHFQTAPCQEDKLVTCVRGAIFDVIVDVRRDAPTCGRSFTIELSAEARNMLYVPQGFAHGFQTLADDSEVLYMISEPYSSAHVAGIVWDDPTLAIAWPPAERIISERDRRLPRLSAALARESR
jgi:dTDP-4-dehydrorhamnose 3,5-epimerase